MQDCVFCKIVKREIPSNKVYEDKEVLVFKDIHPLAPVHLLIIPKKHIKNLGNTSEKDLKILGKCQIIAGKVAKKVGIGESFRLLTATGAGAGQTVFHLHYHLIGGWKKDVPEMEVKEDKWL
jgi:histidine triad (HIT) family protein